MSNIKQYTPKQREELKKKGYTDFDIAMDLVSVMEEPGRLVEVTKEQWENARSTCMI